MEKQQKTVNDLESKVKETEEKFQEVKNMQTGCYWITVYK